MQFPKVSPRGFRHWLANQLIRDVPDELAFCEFDCRKVQCTKREWMKCDRRLHRGADEWARLSSPSKHHRAA